MLEQAKQCATNMISAAGSDNFKAGSAKQKIERDVNPLGKEIQRALNELSRDELFSNTNTNYQPPDIENNNGGGGGTDYDQMDSLIQSSDDLLRGSHAVLSETEEIGTSTLQQMGRQREQLENANEHVRAVQNVALQAKNILQGMSRKALKSKLFLYFLITVLGGANLYVLYLIYMKHFSSSDSTPP